MYSFRLKSLVCLLVGILFFVTFEYRNLLSLTFLEEDAPPDREVENAGDGIRGVFCRLA